MNSAAPDILEKSKIEKLVADLSYKNALSTNLIAIAGSILITFFLSSLLEGSLTPWLVIMLTVSGARLLIYKSYYLYPEKLSSIQWINLYTAASFFAGASWAGIALYLPDASNSYATSVIFLVILVVLTGALPTLSASLRTFYAFAIPLTLAGSSFFLLDGSRLSFYISLSTIMYVFFMLSAGRHLNRHIIDSFVLLIKNQALIENLNTEISHRNNIQAELERNQQALEDTVNLRTRELRKTNDTLVNEIQERKRIEQNLKHLAHHDALTNLPNRLLLDARLNHAIERANRNNQKVAVLFVDLDHFKNINDSLGHEVGDALLMTVSRRLQKSVREVDTVARLGGDEFIIIIEQINETSDLDNVLDKIKTATSKTTTIREHELYTSASIGISLFPDDGQTAEQLLRNADSAMYQAKETGRHKHHFYTRELTASAYDRVILEADLRRAMESNQLEVYYQPQISLKTENVVGVEALIRWNHPEHGLLAPDQFLPIAEQSGMMVRLGEWVLQTACQQMVRWRDNRTSIKTMAVNLSGTQIRHSELLGTVKRVLKQTGCKTEWLELEITEDFIIKEAERSIDTLQQLRDLGISLAIDDFGTGYSSLSHLKRLPVNKLKIDRSFVRDINRDMEDAALVQAIIAMGQSLDLKLIAEGVENSSHEIFLEAQGCDIVQGYYYSRPIPASELDLFLDNFKKQRHNIKLYSSGA